MKSPCLACIVDDKPPPQPGMAVATGMAHAHLADCLCETHAAMYEHARANPIDEPEPVDRPS
jgi:hypothetical protein